MLSKLSGTTHQVMTAHCLWRAGSDVEAVALSTARVTMRPLSAQVPHGGNWARLSDHLPLVVTLELPQRSAPAAG